MDELTAECTLICKLRGSLMCLALFLDMIAMDVCATRQWQMSCRLVQELNDCTVGMFVLRMSTL